MPITPADITAILAEKDSERVSLVCPKHQYTGSKMPPSSHGCSDCWKVYYIFDLATTPPSLRKERLDELEHVVRKVADMQQKGTWDFVPQERPTIEFTQDGLNDETGNYREDEK
jgi:hypothetical protein